MFQDVDAVIAALRVALNEAQHSNDFWWRVEASNRWVRQLPGRWTGRWRNLMLRGDDWSKVPRREFIGHVRATIAFLETNRAEISTRRFWPRWPWFSRSAPPAIGEPIDAEFVELSPAKSERSAKSKRVVRVIK